jgi:hypothetical protein
MRLIAICGMLVFVGIVVLVLFPPGSDYSIDNVVKAWANPARQDVPTGAITAMFALKSDLALMVIFAVPAGLGALIALAARGDRR